MTDLFEEAAWQGIGLAAVSDTLGRLQAMRPSIRDLTGLSVAGRAYTVRAMPGDSRTLHEAVDAAQPGMVLVVDAGGSADRAVWGEVLTAAAAVRGIRGVVIDGFVRDIGQIARRQFAVFARGAAIAGPHKGGGGMINGPIQCGGVVVHPGDLVLGTGDGVVVVPSVSVATIHEQALARVRTEQQWLERVERGESTLDVLGLRNPVPTGDQE